MTTLLLLGLIINNYLLDPNLDIIFFHPEAEGKIATKHAALQSVLQLSDLLSVTIKKCSSLIQCAWPTDYTFHLSMSQTGCSRIHHTSPQRKFQVLGKKGEEISLDL